MAIFKDTSTNRISKGKDVDFKASTRTGVSKPDSKTFIRVFLRNLRIYHILMLMETS